MLGFLLAWAVVRHPVAVAMTTGWIAALLVLGTGPGVISWLPVAAMTALSGAVWRYRRERAADRDHEQAQAEYDWLTLQAELNARALLAEWERRREFAAYRSTWSPTSEDSY